MPPETEVILQDKNRRKDGPAHSEDLALKSAAAYFGAELIHWLGIRERASERYSRLILLLSKENKNDLIVKIASDPEYREALYKQYGI